MKLLICGDSFAADWTVKYPGEGWPNIIAQKYDVTNLAQAGCSEYKVYLQLANTDLSNFDAIIISHSTPSRFYVREHPLHSQDPLHRGSDLIYSDIKEASTKHKHLKPITEFFENYIDLDYMEFVYQLICEKIDTLLSDFDGKVLHVSHLPWRSDYQFANFVQLDLIQTNRGLLNHYDEIGNKLICQKMCDWIETG